MARKTSVDTFNKIKQNGLLPRKRSEVYSILYEFGPMTGGEVAKKHQELFNRRGVSESIRNRITELVKQGAVEELGERPCNITGNNSILFQTTDELPKKLENKKQELYVLMDRTTQTALLFNSIEAVDAYKLKKGIFGEPHRAKFMKGKKSCQL